MAMLFFLTSIVIHPTPQKTENQQFELRKETGDKIIYYNIYWREGDSPWRFLLTRYTGRVGEKLPGGLPTPVMKDAILYDDYFCFLIFQIWCTFYMVYQKNREGIWEFKDSMAVSGTSGMLIGAIDASVKLISPFVVVIKGANYSVRGKKKNKYTRIIRYSRKESKIVVQ
ncbi:MAG: hypothetical protein KAT34_16980 [Candidatus Aminicenantes bacterium]|nr:hypothetical protein [Candidatus Aminicenantes bacterium]